MDNDSGPCCFCPVVINIILKRHHSVFIFKNKAKFTNVVVLFQIRTNLNTLSGGEANPG